jgi:hypothetical protein
MIIRTHIVFTDGRQRKPNHNTTTRPSVNTVCGRIMIGLSLFSVSKHNMWSYYDWVYCCSRPSVNIICGRIMIGLSLSSVSKHNIILCLLTDDNNDNPIITRPHIVFTDGRQRQLNYNDTICGRIMIGFIVVLVRQ